MAELRFIMNTASRGSSREQQKGSARGHSSQSGRVASARSSSARGSSRGSDKRGGDVNDVDNDDDDEEPDELLERAKRWKSHKRDGWRWGGRPGHRDALGKAVLGQAQLKC